MSCNESEAVVTALDDGDALVRVTHPLATCGRCEVQGACGKAALAGDAPRIYRVRNDIDARIGDEVLLSIPAGAVLKAAAISYLVPAVLAIVGAWVGTALGTPLALGGAVVGVLIGIAILRYSHHWLAGKPEPLLGMRIKRHVIPLEKET